MLVYLKSDIIEQCFLSLCVVVAISFGG